MQGDGLAETTQFIGLDLPMIVYNTFNWLVAAPGLPLSGPAEHPIRPLSEALKIFQKAALKGPRGVIPGFYHPLKLTY